MVWYENKSTVKPASSSGIVTLYRRCSFIFLFFLPPSKALREGGQGVHRESSTTLVFIRFRRTNTEAEWDVARLLLLQRDL
ncbi:hypothetical protein F2P81_002959 [Scophthalmus maximus]|uniref:Uncharacterized protein n=1 Tax=Scophthalmus maximus TaxID=52904 RepID=A0A6A4TLP8_SCOMX|nr:hypothetical protein F2P81_002959 [Scophthalmus maximus]